MHYPHLLLFALALALPSCRAEVDPASPEGALAAFAQNVKARDIDALFAQLSAQTIKDLKATREAIAEQDRLIGEKYPAAQKKAFSSLYPKPIRGAKNPKSLFAAMVDEQLTSKRFLDGLMYGLEPYGKPTIAEGRTRVLSRSGENYEFILESGAWKTTLFERPIRRNLERVLSNQSRLQENLTLLAAAALRKAKAPDEAQTATPEPAAEAGKAALGQSP